MANIRFFVDKANNDKEGFVPIKARVFIDNKDISKIIGKVKYRDWSKAKQRVIESRPNEEEINSRLDNFEHDAKKYFAECKRKNIKITPEIVRDYFKGIKLDLSPVKKEFWEAYDEFLSIGELERAANTIRNRKTIKNKLKEFEMDVSYKMTFDRINLVFYDKLKEYILITKGHSYNYLSAITDKFKAFMNWSIERDYHNNMSFKKFSAPEKEGNIIHLTFQELQQLINFQFENKKLEKARDFYCFGCLTGLRYCDLQRLAKVNIIIMDGLDGIIKTTTQKTNREVIIPLFPGLQSIIDRYPELPKILPKFSNQKLNEYIKECCKLARINTLTECKTFEKNFTKTEFKPKYELIGTHTARKTFICLAYERGLDIELIKSITGITREKTLRRYLHISTDVKKEKLAKAFAGL